MTLLAFCQTAIRLGSSRALAFKQWRKYHPSETRAEFERKWKIARDLEELFTPAGGVRRDA